MKANTKAVLDYVVEHDGEDFTAKDIAAALSSQQLFADIRMQTRTLFL